MTLSSSVLSLSRFRIRLNVFYKILSYISTGKLDRFTFTSEFRRSIVGSWYIIVFCAAEGKQLSSRLLTASIWRLLHENK